MTVGLVERERKGFDWVGARCVLTLLLGTQRERESTHGNLCGMKIIFYFNC